MVDARREGESEIQQAPRQRRPMGEEFDVDAVGVGWVPGEPGELVDSELERWMQEHHEELRKATARKAEEYGSLDLKLMGATLGTLWDGIADNPAAEMQAAIAFYLLGKVSRVLSALAEGQPPPTDSWDDAEVYAMMGRYVQEHGRWP